MDFGTQAPYTEPESMAPLRRSPTKVQIVDGAGKTARKPGSERSNTRQPTLFRVMDIESSEPNHREKYSIVPEGRNVVVFGDSGVGKSSLINMLNGRKTAETSNGALGCTFESRRHSVTIQGQNINVWDTAGLDEGTKGRVPPQVAEKNLAKLLHELATANGIHLLVYCIRGSSVRKSLARNYAIFHSAICRKKVPIVAVVTGLENQPFDMDDWWSTGGKELARYKMRFDDHACVTTMDMAKAANSVFKERSILSQNLVRKLIIDHCYRVATRPPSDTNIFIKAALQDFRSMMKFGLESVQPTSTVVFCQTDFKIFCPSVFGDLRRIVSHINGRTIYFQHAGDFSERYITPKVSKGGADLLIFVGSLSGPNVEKLQRFYARCTGEVCPLLVITYDATSVDPWKERLNALGIDARVEPLYSSSVDKEQVNLSNLTDELCLVRGPERYRKANLLNLFRRKTKELTDGVIAEARGGR